VGEWLHTEHLDRLSPEGCQRSDTLANPWYRPLPRHGNQQSEPLLRQPVTVLYKLLRPHCSLAVQVTSCPLGQLEPCQQGDQEGVNLVGEREGELEELQVGLPDSRTVLLVHVEECLVFSLAAISAPHACVDLGDNC